MSDTVFLVNPASANGSTGRAWPEIAHRAAAAGLDGETLFSEGPGGIATVVERAAGMGAKRVVVVGGDGTVNEAANGLLKVGAGKEVELATTEITARAKRAGSHVGFVAAGGALALAGVLVLLAALVLGLSDMGLAPWAAALIVGGLTAAAGYVLVTKGMSALRTTTVMPTRAIESMKEDARWTTKQGA